MIVLFLRTLGTVSFLTAWISLLLYLSMPAAWLCETGEMPDASHRPSCRCPRRLSALGLMTVVNFAVLGMAAGAEQTPFVFFRERMIFQGIALLILLPAVLSDVDYRIIPDQCCLAGCLLGLFRGMMAGWRGLGGAFGGLLLCGGLMLLSSLTAWLISGREGMGMGDVKLAAACGSLAAASAAPGAWGIAACAVFVGAVMSSGVWFSVLLLLGRARYGDARPMAPWIVLSALLVLGGSSIVSVH